MLDISQIRVLTSEIDITQDVARNYERMTPIVKLPGVGPALAKAMQDHGIRSVEDVAARSEAELTQVPRLGAARAASLKAAAQKMAKEGAAPASAASKPAASPKRQTTAARKLRTTRARPAPATTHSADLPG